VAEAGDLLKCGADQQAITVGRLSVRAITPDSDRHGMVVIDGVITVTTAAIMVEAITEVITKNSRVKLHDRAEHSSSREILRPETVMVFNSPRALLRARSLHS
jgi:hypothetical protein